MGTIILLLKNVINKQIETQARFERYIDGKCCCWLFVHIDTTIDFHKINIMQAIFSKGCILRKFGQRLRD